ncbi:MAG TPA: hypothetical protein VFQ85_02610 [Mycobacteriales bacterium]|nr:hypothetical protein [Mycobacteriales bacterium]
MSEGLNVPPSFYDPLPPPQPPKQRGIVVAGVVVAVVLGLVTLVGAVAVVHARRTPSRLDAVRKRASDAVTERLRRPADTDTLPRGRDGSVRYVSQPTESDEHAWHATLPRAWSAYHVAARSAETVVLDSLLRRVTPDGRIATVTVERTTSDRHAIDSEEFQTYLRRTLTVPSYAMRISSPYSPIRVGDERGWYFDGTRTQEGTQVRMRVVAIQHGGETFLAFLRVSPEGWRTVLPEFERILASWGYGA